MHTHDKVGKRYDSLYNFCNSEHRGQDQLQLHTAPHPQLLGDPKHLTFEIEDEQVTVREEAQEKYVRVHVLRKFCA